MTARAGLLAVAAALALGAAGCAAPAADPVDPGHPLVLRVPEGWDEVPLSDPAGSGGATAAGPEPDGAEVLLRAEPGDGSAALTATAVTGRVSMVEAGVSLAEAGREARWQDYRSTPAEAVEVPGADAARRVEYRYTCAETGDPCAGTVFVLLRDRDAYLVRLSGRGADGASGAADEVRATLGLTA